MKTLIKIISFILSVAISYGQEKVTVVMPYNSTNHSLQYISADTSAVILITGYACGIGPVEGNQSLALRRAMAVKGTLELMGYHKFEIRTILLTERGSAGWKATVEYNPQGTSISEYIATQIAKDGNTNNHFSNPNQPIALEGPYSVWDTDTTVTNSSSPLGTDMCNPYVDSSFLFEAIDSLEKELERIDNLYEEDSDEDEDEDAIIPCDCNFPSNLTPESALGWRRNVYRTRGSVNTREGVEFTNECLNECLIQMLKLENQKFSKGHVVSKSKKHNVKKLSRQVARKRAWREFKSKVMGCFIASRK